MPDEAPGTQIDPAVQAAVDELVGVPPAATAAAGDASKADAAKAVEQQAAGETERREGLAELQAFAQAQERWGRDRAKLEAAAGASKDSAKRELLEALQSEDPDGALEQLGLSQDQRRAITSRMVRRHVPADKSTPELRHDLELDELKSEIRAMKAREKQREEAQVKERTEVGRRQQVEQTLATLRDALQNAGEDAKLVSARYGKRRDATLADAIDVAKELQLAGEISTRMSEKQIAQRIVTGLQKRYREDFGLADGSTPPAAGSNSDTTSTRSSAAIIQKAAEANAARTITRDATAVTRPPTAKGPRSEDEDLDEWAKELARSRREGKPLQI